MLQVSDGIVSPILQLWNSFSSSSGKVWTCCFFSLLLSLLLPFIHSNLSTHTKQSAWTQSFPMPTIPKISSSSSTFPCFVQTTQLEYENAAQAHREEALIVVSFDGRFRYWPDISLPESFVDKDLKLGEGYFVSCVTCSPVSSLLLFPLSSSSILFF